ncbi:MAG: HAMP domain-containing sensor histidine kinase [Planctomycetota bacterium]
MSSSRQPTPDDDASIEPMAGAIAHEVNNLLTPIVGLADVLRDRDDDSQLRDDLLEQTIDRCQRAVSICGLLLDLSKEADRVGSTCNVADAMRAAVECTRQAASAASVRIELAFHDEGIAIVPAPALEHVLINLILNAVRASNADGTVRLDAAYRPATAWQKATWTIRVADRGKGLDERDVRAIRDGHPPRGSRGLGLVISRQLCDLWGGSLAVESTPDRGSTFSIEVPAG